MEFHKTKDHILDEHISNPSTLFSEWEPRPSSPSEESDEPVFESIENNKNKNCEK